MYKIPASTLFLGKNLLFMPECHSTNTVALELCHRQAVPEGTLVITNQQTSGRGQRGNTWESADGMNLTFSVILKPGFLAVTNQFLLSIITSLAIHDYLAKTCDARISIKWPNDILANEFKISGILIENQLMGQQFTNVVVGIGLNVNQQQFASAFASSMALVSKKLFDLQEVLEGVLNYLEARYLQLRQNKVDELKADYLENLYRLQELHSFQSMGQEFEGRITGVDADGKLRVLSSGGERAYGIKEISFVQ